MAVQHHTPPPPVAAEHLCELSAQPASAQALQSAAPRTLARPPPSQALLARLRRDKTSKTL